MPDPALLRHPDGGRFVTIAVMLSRPFRFVDVVLPLALVAACIPAASQRAPGPTAEAAITDGSPIPSPSPSPSGPSARPSFVRPTPTPLPTFLAYLVKRGDTLTSIARAYRTTARSIAFWNRAQHPSLDPDSTRYAPNRIEVGWILLLVPDVELDPDDLPAEPTSSVTETPSAVPGVSASPGAASG